MSISQWYCCSTKIKQEKIAKESIEKLGLETFLPLEARYHDVFRLETVLTKKGYIRKQETVRNLYPYFSGYLFIKFDVNNELWKKIPTCRGVHKLFSLRPDFPVPLKQGALEYLMSLHTTPDRAIDPRYRMPKTKDIEQGQEANILSGAFTGHRASCIQSTEEKAEFLINMFNRDINVILDRGQYLRVK